MKVTYFHHSGFAVETETKVLLFDYYTENGRKAYFEPEAYGEKEIFVFVSHVHEDHYDRRILRWAEHPRLQYLFSEDVPIELGFCGNVRKLKVQETYEIGDMTVTTLQSNDQGVAFLVKADGKTIYHAGDLNWWHWNGESDAFNEEIKQSYTTEINRLQGEAIDVAFVPADGRLEDRYFLAVEYFLQTVGAKVLFPMHFWGDFSICKRLREKPYGEPIQEITTENQTFVILE